MPPYLNGVPYVNTDTSKEAARLVDADSHEARVYRHILRSGSHGVTDDEIEQALEMRHQTASARRRGLVMKLLVVDSGQRRPTSSGRDAIVWVIAKRDLAQAELFERGNA
jgi:hypothetical protein